MGAQPKILILGGTIEARHQAEVLASQGYDLIYALAGVTQTPVLPNHANIKFHRGGFGGLEGLQDFIKANKVDCLVDATHPFAELMSNTCRQVDLIPVVHLARTAWQQTKGDQWLEFRTLHVLKEALPPKLGGALFLALGAKHIQAFADLKHLSLVARMIEVPKGLARDGLHIIQQRGPFSVNDEMALFSKFDIKLLVTRNSGTDASYAKVEAARALGIPVFMVQQPDLPADQKGHKTIPAAQLVSHLSLLLG